MSDSKEEKMSYILAAESAQSDLRSRIPVRTERRNIAKRGKEVISESSETEESEDDKRVVRRDRGGKY